MLLPRMMIASGALLSASLIAASAAQAQTTWYVNDDGDAGNGCTSWLDACPELQTALSLAGDGDQIWLAEGTYRPDYDVNIGQHTGDREASFHLISGVALYGGFDGTESTLEERAGLFDQTILTGDLNGDDAPNESDCCAAHPEPSCDDPTCEAAVCAADPECCDTSWDAGCAFFAAALCGDLCASLVGNSYHVVTGSDTDLTAILDGFTITAGIANGHSEGIESGGGLYTSAGSPTVLNCIFQGNWAGIMVGPTSTCCAEHEDSGCDDEECEGVVCYYDPSCCSGEWTMACAALAQQFCYVCLPTYFGGGGAIYNTNSDPEFTDCEIIANLSLTDGGGMYNENSNPTLTTCTFRRNAVVPPILYGRGGGLYNDHSEPSLSGCTFEHNTATTNGGGMFNYYSSPLVDNCVFGSNSSARHGGGMVNGFGSSPTVAGCVFSNNIANHDGGGMRNYTGNGISPLIMGCSFIGNTAQHGGGMDNHSGPPIVINCRFIANSASSFGGGMHNFFTSPEVTNCVFSGNSAYEGGGISNDTLSDATIINCTFSHNEAQNGGGIANDFGCYATVANSVLWENVPDQIFNGSSSSTTVHYSNVQGWNSGPSNISLDPLFVDADGADDIVGTVDDDLRLLPGSPCIDRAENAAVPQGIADDADGDPRFVDDLLTWDLGNGDCPLVDMGAYEFQDGTTTCCPADFDNDGTVGAADLAELLGSWGPCEGCPADLDGDGAVGPFDLALLLGNWGLCP